MPINSVTITATAEAIKTYFIKTYDDSTVFIKTTKSKFDSLKNLIETLGVEIQDWGELSDFNGVYEI